MVKTETTTATKKTIIRSLILLPEFKLQVCEKQLLQLNALETFWYYTCICTNSNEYQKQIQEKIKNLAS